MQRGFAKAVVVCFLFSIITGVDAQNRDSLEKILQTSVHDSSRMDALFMLAGLADQEEIRKKYSNEGKTIADKLQNSGEEILRVKGIYGQAVYYLGNGFALLNSGESKNAIEFFNKALSLYKSLQFKKGLAESYNGLGVAHYNTGHIEEAINYYNKSFVLMEELGLSDGLGAGLYNIAVIFRKQGNIPKALLNLRKAIKIFEKINHKMGIAYSLMLLGEIYSEQGDHNKGLENYFKCRDLLGGIGDKHGLAVVNNNIGFVYNKKGNKEKALEYHLLSLKLREETANKPGIAMSLVNIGQILQGHGDLEGALNNYKRSLELRKSVQDKWGISNSFANLAGLLYEKKKYKEARSFGDSSLTLARELGYIESISGAELMLSKIDSAMGNYFGAFQHFKSFRTYNDSLKNVTNRKASIKSQLNFEFDKKEAILLQKQEAERKVNSEKDKFQKMVITAGFAGFLLVLTFAVFIYRSLRQKKKAYHTISVQKQEVEKQKEMVEVKNRIIVEKQSEIIDSIRYAKRIQGAMLPSQRLLSEYLPDSFVLYKPKDIVAGDFYWMEIHKDLILFAAADCTGHGVPGAMVSVVCHNALNRAVREFGLTEPGKILDKARELIINEFEKSDEDVKDGMDISLCVLNTKARALQWAGANNPIWMVSENGAFEEIKANKQPIGKYSEPKPFTTHNIKLNKGDMIYIFTDGFQDQFGGEKGKKLKSSGVKKLLLNVHHENADRQHELVNRSLEEWKGGREQVDDICMIGVKV